MPAKSSKGSSRSDGFELIPRYPRGIYLLKLNPLLHHLPTILTGRLIKLWRIPSTMMHMHKESVVVLWQDGPNAGIHGIAVPHEKGFTKPQPIAVYPEHLDVPKYRSANVKLSCIYVLPTPILQKTLDLKHCLAQPTGLRQAGWTIQRNEWHDIYHMIEQGRQPTIAHPPECVATSEDDNFEDDPYAHARKIWTVLTKSAAKNAMVDATDLSRDLGVPLDYIKPVMRLIQSVSGIEGHPSLAALVQMNGETADTFEDSAANSSLNVEYQTKLQHMSRAAFSFNWDVVPNPFDFTLKKSSQQVIEELIKNPTAKNAEDIYVLIKARGTAQQVFARLMRRIYDMQCAICGFSVPFALEAAHIKPWIFCTQAERLLPSNGLLLCALHHKLFDSGMITLNPELTWKDTSERYIVKVLAASSLLTLSKADVDCVKSLDGVEARLPLLPQHRPSSEFLEFRKNWVAEKISPETRRMDWEDAEHFL